MKLRIALVTGGHRFDVPAFLELFRAFPDMDVYPHDLAAWADEPVERRRRYDAVVFYHFYLPEPPPANIAAALEDLTAAGQGLVVLHHALLAYTDWPFWSDVVGIANRKFYPPSPKEQRLPVNVVNPTHPITRGLPTYAMVDEIYLMDDTLAATGNTLLLETEHPRGQKAIAWTRQAGKSRVFCFQSGHDAVAYNNPSFRDVLGRGIRWTVAESTVPATRTVLKIQNGGVVLHEEPTPVCGPTQLLCQTLFTGVTNGTERIALLATQANDGVIRDKGGYQHVARVVEVGRLVDGYVVGDLIFSGTHRGHFQYFTEETQIEFPLFARIPVECAIAPTAFCGMASIAVHDMRRSDTRFGDRVLVMGAGPIGQLICQAARAAGASTVIADRDSSRLAIAQQTGAEETVCLDSDAAWERLYQLPAFDIVFETTGAPILDKLVGKNFRDKTVLRRRGTLSLVALRQEINYVHGAGHWNELQIHHISHFRPDDLAQVIRLTHQGILQLAPLVKEVLPIREAPAFYDRLRDNPATTFGTVFSWRN